MAKYLKGLKEKEAEGWLDCAAIVAKKAMCLRAKCGSVIVKNNKIIGSGYNAPPLDSEKNRTCSYEYKYTGKKKYDRTCCIHAEWRAIIDALKNHPKEITGSCLYFMRIDDQNNKTFAGKPFCTVCSRLALDVGILEFVLWHDSGICVYRTSEYNRLSYQYIDEVSY